MGQTINKITDGIRDLFSHDESFGLPPGTIRSFVLMMMSATVCYMSIKGLEISETLASAFGLAVGYSFGKFSNNNKI